MLEAIADFWKPSRKMASQPVLKAADLQIGSAIGFGFVPQATLSGRRFNVTAINTYKFGVDTLTSFVLSQEKDAGASMIIAQSDGEPYLALARRISISDRNKLFTHEEIEAVIGKEDISTLSVKEPPVDYKGWLVESYKRNIRGVEGKLYKGDYRNQPMAGQSAQAFSYTLLVSNDDEHALEIEKYDDGRIEVYATVYRRMTDIGEVSHPSAEAQRPDVKLVSNSEAKIDAPSRPEPKLQAAKAPETPKETPKEMAKETPKPSDVKTEVASAPITLQEFPAEAVAKKYIEEIPAAPSVAVTIKASSQPFIKQEITTVNKEISNFVNESIECELHVANKIIDEAIRNEMRINDVVRRVIGLPVSQQEAVQIPVTLTDQDYSLLAIRYGISASDHDAIKRRITEDLGDFSGSNKKKAA